MNPAQGTLLLALLSCGAVSLLAAQGTAKKKPGKPCEIVLEQSPPGSTMQTAPQGSGGKVTVYLGGGVRLSCAGQNVKLTSDSLISYDDYDTFTMIGNVHYRDDDYDITTDTLFRQKAGEVLTLRGRVVTHALGTGSTLQAPAVDYYRQVPKVNEMARMLARGGSDAMIFPKRAANAKGKVSPYHVTSDRLEQIGEEIYQAFGNAQVERDSLRILGDSIKYYSTKSGMAHVWGAPGRVLSFASDSARLQGLYLVAELANDETIRQVKGYHEVVFVRDGAILHSDTLQVDFKAGKVTGTLAWSGAAQTRLLRDGATITSDSLQVGFKAGKINSIFAWSGQGRAAHLVRDGYDAYADSLAVMTENDRIDELRLFRNGRVEQPLDSASQARSASDTTLHATRRDWIAGQRVTVTFAQADSAGTKLTLVHRLEATQHSCSLSSRGASAGGKGSQTSAGSINYTCADRITVEMKAGLSREVDAVRFRGHVNGAILEPDPTVAPPPRTGGITT